ncbi:MAG: hypothetical protein ACTSRS_02570 [Candidatus Helarchaeota archaeon]
MAKPELKRQGTFHSIFLIVTVISLLLSMQLIFSTLTASRAAYFGIEFGTEVQVRSEGTADVWQLDQFKYSYIANNQIKPEIDLIGLNVSGGINKADYYRESNILHLEINNDTVDYNYTFSFSLPITEIVNVTFTFTTNTTYSPSAVEFYNWTAKMFYNQSQITNITNFLVNIDFYNQSAQNQELLIHFSTSQTGNFTFRGNLTVEIWYAATQIVSIYYSNLPSGNTLFNDRVKTWIFFDIDGNDTVDYAIRWIYGSAAVLFEITTDSFYSDGVWTGELKKYWTGIGWSTSSSGPQKDLGILESSQLNLTIPAFVLNLTAAVRYSVWTVKIETLYQWWDALPNDPNWQVTVPIPGFQLVYLVILLGLVGVIFSIRLIKAPLQKILIQNKE